MMLPNIIRTNHAQYSVEFDGQDAVRLNFLPLINKYQLTGDFCLVHWRAKPRGLTNWGVYESRLDRYLSFEREQFKGRLLFCKLLGVDNPEFLPSEVVYVRGHLKPTDDGAIAISLREVANNERL